MKIRSKIKIQKVQKKNSENKDNEWRRLRMIEAGEVNGVRFPPGIIIDVNAADGEKLVESKKAEYVNVDKSDENSETEENKVMMVIKLLQMLLIKHQ